MRPRIKIKPTTTDYLMDVIGTLLLGFTWIHIAIHYHQLPDKIPTHYDLLGNADDYGSKNSIFMLPIISTFIYVGMSVLSYFPHSFNYLVEITAENALKQYTAAVQLLRLLKLSIVITFLLIDYETIQLALNHTSNIGKWMLPVTLLLIFAPIVLYFWKSSRKSA